MAVGVWGYLFLVSQLLLEVCSQTPLLWWPALSLLLHLRLPPCLPSYSAEFLPLFCAGQRHSGKGASGQVTSLNDCVSSVGSVSIPKCRAGEQCLELQIQILARQF